MAAGGAGAGSSNRNRFQETREKYRNRGYAGDREGRREQFKHFRMMRKKKLDAGDEL